MAASSLPARVRASSAVNRNAQYSGVLAISALPRLVQLAESADGELAVDFTASLDTGRMRRLRGRITGDIHLLCQRCLTPYPQALAIAVDLVMVGSDAEEARLLHDHEPLWIVDDSLELHALVEDEVMLALPLAAHCGKADCNDIASTFSS